MNYKINHQKCLIAIPDVRTVARQRKKNNSLVEVKRLCKQAKKMSKHSRKATVIYAVKIQKQCASTHLYHKQRFIQTDLSDCKKFHCQYFPCDLLYCCCLMPAGCTFVHLTTKLWLGFIALFILSGKGEAYFKLS